MIDAPTCAVCHEKPSPDGYACTGCCRAARGRLRGIQELTPDARAVARGEVRRGTGGAHGKPGSRTPGNDAAMETLDGVQNVMTTLARDIAETRGLDVPDAGAGDPIVVAAAWLDSQVEWLRHATDGTDLWAPGSFAEIRDCLAKLRGLVNGPSERKYLGPCGAVRKCEGLTADDWPEADCGHHLPHEAHDGEPCRADVYAIVGAETGRCRTCGTEVKTRDRQAWLDGQVRDRAFGAKWISEAYGVPVKTIESWTVERPEQRNHEGKLIRSATPIRLWAHAHDRDGHPLYLVAHVLDLAAAAAARRAEQQARRARRKEQADTEGDAA